MMWSCFRDYLPLGAPKRSIAPNFFLINEKSSAPITAGVIETLSLPAVASNVTFFQLMMVVVGDKSLLSYIYIGSGPHFRQLKSLLVLFACNMSCTLLSRERIVPVIVSSLE
jgi:hypothetical protein